MDALFPPKIPDPGSPDGTRSVPTTYSLIMLVSKNRASRWKSLLGSM